MEAKEAIQKTNKKKGGVKVINLAKGIVIFGRNNRFKKILFKDKEKAQRIWEKCQRKGLDAQLMY